MVFHFPKPSDPLRLGLPRSWPLFPLSPAMVCPSQALSETAREAGPGSAAWPPASGTSAGKPMGDLALGAKPLTEDSFLQTGSFDSFSEPAVLLCAVVDIVFPQIPHFRSILKVLSISFSVLHPWPQSVEILPVCTVPRGRSLPDTSRIASSLSRLPRVWSFPSVASPACLCPCTPSPSMLSPRLGSMDTMTSEPSHASSSSARWCRLGLSHCLSSSLCSEEGKLSTSQDAACKDVEESPETAEGKSVATRPPSSSPEQR